MRLLCWKRRLVTATLFVAACSCSKNKPEIQSALAAPQATGAASAKAGPSGGDVDETPPAGIDVSKLDDFGRRVFFRVVNREASACGKGHSLIYSVKHDASCKKSFYAIRYVANLVNSGYTDSEIGEELYKRFRDGQKYAVDVSRAPLKGSPAARVAVVEFVDYECPHCRTAQTMLRELVEAYPNDVKVYFKHYPLSSHTNSRLAAEGAVAAQKQGKFWPFNDKVWDKADFLTPALLEQIAKQAGLDVTRWRADKDSEAVKAQVDQDRADGNATGLTATPTIFINGRKYSGRHDLASIRDWVDEELGR